MEPAPELFGEELQGLLEEAWTHLEHRIDQVQKETLQQYAEDLKRFGVPEVSEDFVGKVRCRLHAVLLGPVAEDMRRKVLPESESDAQLVLDDLLDRWELEVEPLLGEAAQQDARLIRRLERKAQRGTRESWQAKESARWCGRPVRVPCRPSRSRCGDCRPSWRTCLRIDWLPQCPR
ncbi:unnamed protein product [Effrenium voratum]|uniref:Uncharacterized protein n=1 Tax=Effrenium voratum TaxID=2562239 RepID=A0AA36INU6_9DINO|nr:unnamed protein product [Effrenium voratum]